MLQFNQVAEYIDEKADARTFLSQSGIWEQYFQLPGHGDDEMDDETTMYLIIARYKNNTLEFHWTDPHISIACVDLAGHSSFRVQ